MPKNTNAIVLAAGQSQRYGATKLLAELHGRPMLQHALAAAQETCPGRVCLVAGHEANRIREVASNLADLVVVNNAYESGIGSSIACGVAACRGKTDAVIVMLADQPLVSSEHLAALLRQWDGQPGSIVATRFSGTNGPPVLFGNDFFDRLERLSGDAGAKGVLRASPAAVTTVAFEPAAVDIDTPTDLAALLNRD